jgi:Beta-galactosidase
VRRTVAGSIAFVIAFAALAGSAGASSRGFIGAVDPFATRCGSDLGIGTRAKKGNCLSDRDLQRMQRSGIKTARWGFRWSEVEKVQGTYDWRITDETIGALANRGIGILPVVAGSPAWAARTYGDAPLKTQAARRGWRRFLRAAVNRYGPHGRYWTSPTLYRQQYPNAKPRPIKAWQIWNEQNIRRGAQYVKPGKYRKLVRLAHRAILKADPEATIVLGGMPGYVRTHAWAYLRRLYKHRRFRQKFDAVALHPYAPDVGHVLVQIDRMRQVMKRYHDAHAPLWITELGWGSEHPSKNKPINQGPGGQKRLLKLTFPLLTQYRHLWRIRHAYWYRWRDPPPGTPGCTFCSSSGLFRSNQDPKPAWKAFKQVVRPHR